MFRKMWWLLIVAFIPDVQVEGKRISQTMCEKYVNDTLNVVTVMTLTFKPKLTRLSSRECSRTIDLILGGENARKGEFRHHVLLGWKTSDPEKYLFDCGGTLISERYVLTAAHCMTKVNYEYPKPVIVRLAELDLTEEADEFDLEIESFTRHPEHQFGRSYHDIALVRLKHRLRFSPLVRPACLWGSESLNMTAVIATGFGRMDVADDYGSDTLRKVKLDVLDVAECDRQFQGLRSFRQGISSSQLCIGSPRGGKDTCQGDSGGPVQVLVNPNGCIYHVVGITSTGMGCGGTAAVYTNVASYLDWIEGIVWAEN